MRNTDHIILNRLKRENGALKSHVRYLRNFFRFYNCSIFRENSFYNFHGAFRVRACIASTFSVKHYCMRPLHANPFYLGYRSRRLHIGVTTFNGRDRIDSIRAKVVVECQLFMPIKAYMARNRQHAKGVCPCFFQEDYPPLPLRIIHSNRHLA